MAATWKSLIVFGILGAALLMIGVPADPCAILYSVEANAGRDSLRASFSVERVNVSSTGEQADSYSSWPSLSANGRFAAFSSVATNLVADDGNDDNDIFVHDRASGLTVRVSKSISGGDASGPSDFPSLSYSGQSVAFSSEADNLHPADPDDITDIFVHDMVSNTTRLVSVSTTGHKANYECEEPRISGDGAAACWSSSANNLVPGDTGFDQDIFLRDILAGTTEMISSNAAGVQGNGESFYPAVSYNGRFVAFESSSSNLVPGGTSGRTLIFLKDRQSDAVTLVSRGLGGQEPNDDCWNAVISGNGRYVSYLTFANNIVDSDMNNTADVFVWDRLLGTTIRASVSTGGVEGNDESNFPSISGDGRRVAFSSDATNLVSGDTNSVSDIFVHFLGKGWTVRVSVSAGGQQGDSFSIFPFFAANGRHVAFQSLSTNLVEGDTNGLPDIFVASYH